MKMIELYYNIPLKAANLDRSRVQNRVQFHKVFGLHHLSKGQYMILTAQYNKCMGYEMLHRELFRTSC
jgi:hypothetical protein